MVHYVYILRCVDGSFYVGASMKAIVREVLEAQRLEAANIGLSK